MPEQFAKIGDRIVAIPMISEEQQKQTVLEEKSSIVNENTSWTFPIFFMRVHQDAPRGVSARPRVLCLLLQVQVIILARSLRGEASGDSLLGREASPGPAASHARIA